jgi:dihydrofolate reductase
LTASSCLATQWAELHVESVVAPAFVAEFVFRSPQIIDRGIAHEVNDLLITHADQALLISQKCREDPDKRDADKTVAWARKQAVKAAAQLKGALRRVGVRTLLVQNALYVKNFRERWCEGASLLSKVHSNLTRLGPVGGTSFLKLQPNRRCGTMAKIVFGMMQSLDGYVAGVEGELEPPLHSPPGIALFRYWIDHVRDLAGSLYGRRMYEVMRYWDEDRPEWGTIEHEFAAAWRTQPKWVASRSLRSVGANATLVGDDLEAFVRRLKADVDGIIAIAGPDLAASLTDLVLIDAEVLDRAPSEAVRPVGRDVFRRGVQSLVGNDRVGEDAVRLTFVTA